MNQEPLHLAITLGISGQFLSFVEFAENLENFGIIKRYFSLDFRLQFIEFVEFGEFSEFE